jgi:hypothetical protein
MQYENVSITTETYWKDGRKSNKKESFELGSVLRKWGRLSRKGFIVESFQCGRNWLLSQLHEVSDDDDDDDDVHHT